MHQRLLFNLSRKIADYIDVRGGQCEVFPAPFAVFLNQDEKNYVEPDISVICDRSKLNDKGCNGAPDWIIEIASPITKHIDYGIKLFKYRNADVKEYWIINPLTNTVNAYHLQQDKGNQYSFDDTVSASIYSDFAIRIADLLK